MTKNKPQITRPKVLNVCQVSLKNNIPLILENFKVFKNNYDKIKIFII